MKAGMNAQLARRTRTAVPSARLMVEAQAVDRSDEKLTQAEWEAADSLTGWEWDDGERGAIITPTTSTPLQNATSNNTTDEVDESPETVSGGPFATAKVDWSGGSESNDFEFVKVSAYLDPAFGGTKDVDTWYCQPYARREDPSFPSGTFQLVPLATPVGVTAPGTAGQVDFTFPKNGVRPKTEQVQTIYIFIWGVDADGNQAANVGWAFDSTVSEVTTSGNVLTGARLNVATSGPGGLWSEDANGLEGVGGTPRVAIDKNVYSAAVIITFSSGNLLDLGATPTGTVRFVARARIPSFTYDAPWGYWTSSAPAVTFEVRNDADTAWVVFEDGDTTDDLSGVGKNQTYKVRVTLTPNATNDATPVVLEMGVEEVTTVDLSNLVHIETEGEGVDPYTLKGEVTRATLRGIHDGITDYRDAITLLLSDYDIGAIEVVVYLGADDLDRKWWMPLQTFQIDETQGYGPALELTLVSPLMLLRHVLPVFDVSTGARTPYMAEATGLKTWTDDILDNQLALSGRYRGPGIPDDTTIATDVITDSDAKDELDAFAYLGGYAWVCSQGRVKAVDMFGDKPVIAKIPAGEIQQVAVSPGWSRRTPEFLVPHDWLEEEDRYDREAHFIQQTAFDKLGQGRRFGEEVLDDIVARKIRRTATEISGASNSTQAATIGNRIVKHFGTGQITIEVMLTYGYPELEPGDLVVVQTDRIVAKDPLAARALRGQLWAAGVVQIVHDFYGRHLTLWVRSFWDLLPSATYFSNVGVADVSRTWIYHASNRTYSDTGTPAPGAVPMDSEIIDDDSQHSTVTNTPRIVPAVDGFYWLVLRVVYTGLNMPSTALNPSIRKNGTEDLAVHPLTASSPASGNFAIAVEHYLTTADYVEMQLPVPLSTPYSITLTGGDTGTTLYASRVPSRDLEGL